MKKIDAYVVSKQTKIILNANECYKNLPSKLIDEIKDNLHNIEFNRYPDNDAVDLTKKYSEVFNINEDNVLFGNGSDEMLGLVIGLNIKEGKKLYTFSPDFSMYDYYVSFHEGLMCKYSIEETFNVDEFIELGKKENPSIIVFSNPNNPTGMIVSKEDIEKILVSFKDIPVVVDEAYGEFYNQTMVNDIDLYKNLYVTKTLSKAYGVAGIRLGIIISNKENIEKLKVMKVPYDVNTLSQFIGIKLLDYKEESEKYIKEIIERREWFYKEIISRNYSDLKIYKSYANFIYGKSSKKEELVNNFNNEGITIRVFKDDSFRISIGSLNDMQEVLRVIDQTFGGVK